MVKTLNEKIFDAKKFKLQLFKEFNAKSKQSYGGAAPNIFVGRFGHPHVSLGVLSAQDYASNDDPLLWKRKGFDIKKIMSLRTQLVNANNALHVKLPSSSSSLERLRQNAQEVAMSVNPVDVDVDLEHKPSFSLSLPKEAFPYGPAEKIKKLNLTSNPKIPRAVEKVFNDDLKASSGLGLLWKKGFTEHHLTKLLTAGTLGTKLERKLVPTRWGITAVDDTIGKQLSVSLRDFQEHEFSAYFGGYQGNYFLLLTFPQSWSFELFENYVDATHKELSTCYTDFEGWKGRSRYAERTAGGYYAARVAVVEHLFQMKRKCGVLALRFITDEYAAPLGVWVVREAVRSAFESSPLVFADETLLLSYAKNFLQKKFGVDASVLFKESLLLQVRTSQKSLREFI